MAVDRFRDAGRRGRELALALGAVAVELDVREMDRHAFGGLHGGERRCHVAGHAEIAGMDMQRMRYREFMQRTRQRRKNRARGHAVMRMRFVDVEVARVELECADAPGVDDLDGDALGGIQRPGNVVVDHTLVGARGHQPQQEIVVAEHGVAALVDDRRITHFHVGLACVDRQHGRLEARGVAHLGIAITGSEGRRRGNAAAGTGDGRSRKGAVAMIFGKHRARDVDLAAADMSMQVDRAPHDDASRKIVLAINRYPWRRRRDDVTVVHEQIAHLAIDPISGIVEPAAAEPDQCGSFIASRMRCKACATDGKADPASLRR